MRSMIRNICLALSVVAALMRPAPAPATGFDDAANLELSVEPKTAKRGQTITVKLTAKLNSADHYHTYPTMQPEGGGTVTVFKFENTPEYVFVDKLQDPPGDFPDPKPLSSGPTDYLYEHEVTWERKIVIRPSAQPGKTKLKWHIVAMPVCNEKGCIPIPAERRFPEAELTITDESQEVDAKYRDAVTKAGIAAPAPPPNPDKDPFQRDGPKTPNEPAKGSSPKSVESGGTKSDETNGSPTTLYAAPTTAEAKADIQWVDQQLVPQKAPPTGSLAFILAGIFWGAVSLVTPCVFPMIPITVSFFLKQSEKKHHRPVTMALVYCATIVIVLTLAAVLLLSLFRQMSTNPYMNIAMGVLFVVFALSLFGMYDLELPSGLARFTSAREGKGGLIGTMFMALTFTIVSFACVAPFLGGFSGTSASNQLSWTDKVLGGLAFAITFASPFFILALFPTLLKKMPKSGTWLNNVKVVMGFLELAAALVFFRTSEVVRQSNSTLFTYDFVLGLWIAIMVICGLYLLNFFRLPHDTPVEHLGVMRMLFGLMFIALGLYLAPALFKTGPDGEKQRPAGVIYAWVDSFLLPESTGNKKDRLPWGANLRAAVEQVRTQKNAKGQPRLILIDFTGETCKNCRYNEENVFTRPVIAELMKKYQLVEMYTDKVPPNFYPSDASIDVDRLRDDADVNLAFQKKAFDTEQLPLYVILDPAPGGNKNKIEVVGIYAEGKINDVAGFQQFLREPLSGSGLRASALIERPLAACARTLSRKRRRQ